MNVNSVGSDYGYLAIDPLLAAGAPRQTGSSPPATSGGTNVSSLASTLSKLEQLQKTDPGEVQGGHGEHREHAAEGRRPGDGLRAQFLGQLADKFRQAAQTGSLLSGDRVRRLVGLGRRPPRPPPPGREGVREPAASGVSGAQASSVNLEQVLSGAMQQVAAS